MNKVRANREDSELKVTHQLNVVRRSIPNADRFRALVAIQMGQLELLQLRVAVNGVPGTGV